MDRRHLKRTFLFTDQEHKSIIESLLLKCAEADDTTVSTIIESAIVDYLANRFPDLYGPKHLQELRTDTPQAH